MRQSEELISNRIDGLVGATTEALEYLHLFGVIKYIGFALVYIIHNILLLSLIISLLSPLLDQGKHSSMSPHIEGLA